MENAGERRSGEGAGQERISSLNKNVSLVFLLLVVMGLAAAFVFGPGGYPGEVLVFKLRYHKDFFRAGNDLKMVSRVEGEDLVVYADGEWQKQFWAGVNLGVTTPGHSPGELSQTYEDYRRWFKDMDELGVRVVRVYTIMPPDFYRALVEHNRAAERELWFIQGIWPPEEDSVSLGDAFHPFIVSQYSDEIVLAVRAVYGKGEIAPRRGQASGHYRVNAAPYLLGWIMGAEWDPYMVRETIAKNPDKKEFRGRYFATAADANPFEVWLAASLEKLAELEVAMGWQHPLSFVNWVTTDPLPHPDEPFENEDLVSIDPGHIRPTDEWAGGLFAAYHVYPYYPDSLRYQQNYQEYVNSRGEKEPYQGYLAELKRHHAGMPLVIAEFGVPASRGMAHRGPLGRNQGMHTEREQGEMNAAMFRAIKEVGAAGGLLFEWHDEWFKFTWNSWDLEIPSGRRQMWLNRLTNEENFGILAVEPGEAARVLLDGRLDDWNAIGGLTKRGFGDGSELMVTSDEGYLYLALYRPGGWDWSKEEIHLGFDTLPGGNTTAPGLPVRFDQGLEFLLSVSGRERAVLRVASAYDQHTFLYGRVLGMIPWTPGWEREDNGVFLPWKLCLSRQLYLPASRQVIPFEEIEVGRLIPGTSDPAAADYNSLADFFAGEETLEIRIPWMMLGY
ncbi:MAG: hypothetical protein QHH02_01680, partial [Syntrophomonadaceae bacterium]|nr:hypothetical protein [Syntrophomonadaceae bacterium]